MIFWNFVIDFLVGRHMVQNQLVEKCHLVHNQETIDFFLVRFIKFLLSLLKTSFTF